MMPCPNERSFVVREFFHSATTGFPQDHQMFTTPIAGSLIALKHPIVWRHFLARTPGAFEATPTIDPMKNYSAIELRCKLIAENADFSLSISVPISL